MKQLNTYIFEKLIINKDTKIETDGSYEKMTPLILALCEVSPANFSNFPTWLKDNEDNIYFNVVNNWVKNNEITHKNLKCYASKKILNSWVRMMNIVDWFSDNPDFVKDISEEYIANGKGTEVLGKLWKDPKIYYDEKVLIYHEHDAKYGNIDRVFVKEK